jgi:glycosyltransferase involved in cell wall biosynthesis
LEFKIEMFIKPLVSVVITTYNRPEKLLISVKSVLNQTYEQIEVIVVDDGSKTPVEPLLLDTFGPRVRCITHARNFGAPKARNTGIKYASGVFIAFLDDDDIWTHDKLSKQIQLYERCDQSVGLVYSGFSYINEGVECLRNFPVLRGEVFNELLMRNFIGSCSIPLIRRVCFDKVGTFDESFKSFQDWDMWLRILQVFRADFVNEVLVIREAHGEQITSDLSRKICGRKLIIDKYINHYSANRSHLSYQYRALSDNYYISGNNSMGFYYSQKALETNIYNYRNLLNFILSLFPEKIRRHIILEKKTQKFGNVRFYR